MRILTLLFVILPGIALSQSIKKDPVLLGKCTIDSLTKEPYSSWFQKAYNDYIPETSYTDQLKKIGTKDISVKIFFGSWCGDSKREVPRVMKTLNTIGLSSSSIQLIAVNDEDSVYKQSPGHEEKGLEIYRVPTIIIQKAGKEIGRINENPVFSLEQDLLTIIKGEEYIANYASYAYLKQWFNEGVLSRDNVSHRGLANKINPIITSSSELNSCGYVLLKRGDIKESIKVFRMNAFMFPQDYNCYYSLAEALLANNEKESAKQAMLRAFELNKTPSEFKGMLELWDKISAK